MLDLREGVFRASRSPGLKLIELAFAKLKTALRATAAALATLTPAHRTASSAMPSMRQLN